MASPTSSSIDSVQSTLRLPEQKNSNIDQECQKFAISVSFVDFKDLLPFCLAACRNDDATATTRSFWLSWVFLDKTFQSEEFTTLTAEPSKVKDTIRVRCSQESLMKTVTADSSMRIFLCTQGCVLAAVALPLLRRTSSAAERGHEKFPLSTLSWNDLEISATTSFGQLNKPSVKVNITISIESEGNPPVKSNSGSSTSRIPRRSPSSSPMIEIIEEGPLSSKQLRSEPTRGEERGVRFSSDCIDDMHDRKAGSRRRNGGNAPRRKNQDDLCETSSEDAGDSYDEADNEQFDNTEDEVDDFTRHYRMNIEVKSIGGLRRAANAAIHFSYPYLGAGGPVRTHPVWLPANTEGRVDGAVASYDCCMSRNRIRDILSEHPLKISAVSRTHLGSANIGEVGVDLFGVMESRPHSFRCPMTNKTFKAREEYISHRHSLLALRSLGQVDRVPAKDPITIWANDSFLPLCVDKRNSSEISFLGGRLRVVIIIEEISIVGAEIATSVKPGYKMHNGALYVIKDQPSDFDLPQGPQNSVEVNSEGNPELPPEPLDRVGLSEVERTALEKLKSDWETFRLATEVQWRNSLKDRESQMRSRLEAEASTTLAERADDLRRAQEEAGRLEVRLRGAIDEAERQKSQLKLREEQMQMQLSQKTSELQLLQRRVREEAKARIDSEVRKSESLVSQINLQKQQIDRYEKRVKDVEREFESFRAYSRGTPESVLREEVARVRAQLGESRGEVERERRIKSEAELEKEHYRAQMHRLAVALKRERERSSASTRQDLDQLRLEFLAREERYVLDGDREELRNIRHELANLRSVSTGQIGGQRQAPELVQVQGAGQTQPQTQLSMPYPVTAQGQPALYQQGIYHDTQQYQMNFPQQMPSVQPYVRAPAPTADYRDQDSLNLNMPGGPSRGTPMASVTFAENVQDVRRDSPSPPPPAAPYSSKTSSTADSNFIEKRSRAIEESDLFSEEEEEEEEEERPRSGVRQAEAPLRPVTADSTRSFYQPDYVQRAPSSSLSSFPIQKAHPDTQQQSQSRIAQQASETVRNLRQQIQDLLNTGVYDEEDDPVIQALRAELFEAERIST